MKLMVNAEGRELCEGCAPDSEEVNHSPGMIFVGWGCGWQPCPQCGGSGLAEAARRKLADERCRRLIDELINTLSMKQLGDLLSSMDAEQERLFAKVLDLATQRRDRSTDKRKEPTMREDDLKGTEECSEMARAVLALNAEAERRTEEIVRIGRKIVLPYFCQHSIAFVVDGHTWTIGTAEPIPDFVYEVLNKDIGRKLPLGSYIGNITEDDWNRYAEEP